jgi:hypothetical protein
MKALLARATGRPGIHHLPNPSLATQDANA